MPGHNLRLLEETFRRALALPGPVIVHVRTQKGKGYRPAERDQVSFHGAALPPMAVPPPTDTHDRLPAANGINGDPMTSAAAGGSQVTAGRAAGSGAPPSASVMADRRTPPAGGEGDAEPPAPKVGDRPQKTPNYTAFFARELVELGALDRRIVAITAGMPTGTGLARFQAAYPDRFFDVGIAEQHAVTFAAGLALGGMRPVVALYSTFLQRASTRSSTTSARTTSRSSSGSTGPGSSARTGRAIRACSCCPPSANCHTS
jgi:deoxyxylulose-5-phosphate synthase